MKRMIFITAAFFALVSCSQTYDVGTSVVSIEPSDETVSLALAGDINPQHPFRTSGVMLAADVLRALGKGLSPVSGKIRFKSERIEIP
ncbi:MAG: hypothetical protein LBB90_10120, partial [Tannerella sp.]|nr:hypothetical protein [Tannerella sp.]